MKRKGGDALHLSNFFHSIKDSFSYKRLIIAEEQKSEQPPLSGKSSLSEKSDCERNEKGTSVLTRHTFINNSGGSPTPLTIRLFHQTPEKKEYAHKTKQIPKNEQILLEFILETENLGPVLIRLERKKRLYYCSVFVESEEVETFLYQDFKEIRLLLDKFLQEARLEVYFIKWNIFLPEEKERLMRSLQKERFLIDKRV